MESTSIFTQVHYAVGLNVIARFELSVHKTKRTTAPVNEVAQRYALRFRQMGRDLFITVLEDATAENTAIYFCNFNADMTMRAFHKFLFESSGK